MLKTDTIQHLSRIESFKIIHCECEKLTYRGERHGLKIIYDKANRSKIRPVNKSAIYALLYVTREPQFAVNLQHIFWFTLKRNPMALWKQPGVPKGHNSEQVVIIPKGFILPKGYYSQNLRAQSDSQPQVGETFLQFFFLLLYSLSFFLNFPSFSSSIWSSKWGGSPTQESYGGYTPLMEDFKYPKVSLFRI